MSDIKKKQGGLPANRVDSMLGHYLTAVNKSDEALLNHIYGLDEIDRHIQEVISKARDIIIEQPENDLIVIQTAEVLNNLFSIHDKLERIIARSMYMRDFAGELSQGDMFTDLPASGPNVEFHKPDPAPSLHAGKTTHAPLSLEDIVRKL
jgi:hypothetical protein